MSLEDPRAQAEVETFDIELPNMGGPTTASDAQRAETDANDTNQSSSNDKEPCTVESGVPEVQVTFDQTSAAATRVIRCMRCGGIGPASESSAHCFGMVVESRSPSDLRMRSILQPNFVSLSVAIKCLDFWVFYCHTPY